jgi:transcriptional regulator with XRE-family HTH domain
MSNYIEMLNKLRKDAGFNISELANVFFVTRSTIYEWLEYKSSPDEVTIKRIETICKIFNDWLENPLPPAKFYAENLIILLNTLPLDEVNIKKILARIKNKIDQERKKDIEHKAALDAAGFKPVSKEQQRRTLQNITRYIK